MVDEDLQPWFLEVNTGPLLNEKQYKMLCDTARIVFYNQPANVSHPFCCNIATHSHRAVDLHATNCDFTVELVATTGHSG